MKGNELIGVAGVFVLTFCLIALYHLIGRIGRHRKRHGAQIELAKEPGLGWRPGHEPLGTSGKDEAWLLWSPKPAERTGPSKPGFPNLREKRDSSLRS
jgi:hypothetical protein